VVVFDRAPNGTLTQKAGTAGCITYNGTGGPCTTGSTSLFGVTAVTVSPDGTSVYVTSYNNGAVLVLDRAANGTLTQKAGTAGCISQDGTSGQCVASSFALQGAWGVTVSPDGKNVYLATRIGNVIAVFDANSRRRP
jgi:DNA-binding beta-propeller fold protein YncE